MSKKDITAWFNEIGLSQYSELFQENEIGIDNLPEIATHDDLKEIGITSFIHRKKILVEIAELSSSATLEQDEQDISSSDELIESPSEYENVDESNESQEDSEFSFDEEENRQSIEDFKELLEKYKSDHGIMSRPVASVHAAIGLPYYLDEQYDVSTEHYLKAVKIYEELDEEYDAEIAECHRNSGQNYDELKQYEKALFHWKISYELFIKSQGEDSYDAEEVKEFIDGILEEMGNSIETENTEQESQPALDNIDAVKLKEEIEIHKAKGDENYDNSNYEDALTNYQAALEKQIKLFGEEHEDVANCYMDIGDSYFQIDKDLLSVENYRNSFNIRKSLFGLDSEETDQSRFELGKAYYFADMEDEAKECFSNSLDFRKEFYGKKSKEYKKAKKWVQKIKG